MVTEAVGRVVRIEPTHMKFENIIPEPSHDVGLISVRRWPSKTVAMDDVVTVAAAHHAAKPAGVYQIVAS